MLDRTDEMAPVDYLVLEFDGTVGSGFLLLVDLVENGFLRVLDLAFLRKEKNGSVSLLVPGELDVSGDADLTALEGASSGLLQPADIGAVARLLEPAKSAVVIVYENTWERELASGLDQGGCRLLASGRVSAQSLQAVLTDVPVRDGD